MKETKKIEINTSDTTKELIIREGDAVKLYDPEKVVINGVITAPQDYWQIRNGFHTNEKCYVVYSASELFVRLNCDEKEKFGTSIGGKLAINSDLHALRINEDMTYTVGDLHKELKFMRQYFKDTDKYSQLLQNLQKFKTSVNKQIEKEISDNRGNAKDNFEVTITTDLALDFVLTMPVYRGGEPTSFKVDICFDVRDRTIDLWLESVELKEAQYNQAQKAIGDVINYFKAEGLVCIEV